MKHLCTRRYLNRHFYKCLDNARHLLRQIKKFSRKNWKKYLNKRASKYWSKLSNRQRKQLNEQQLHLGDKVLVQDISKSGISQNKLDHRRRGPFEMIGRAANNNACKSKHCNDKHIDWITILRLLKFNDPVQNNINQNDNDNDDLDGEN